MENIQVIKTNGSFALNLKSGEKKVSYQSLECVVNEFNLHLEEVKEICNKVTFQ